MNDQTTRTCTACGYKKPLVAFLEIAGEHGHSYGNVCANCRGVDAHQKETGTADNAGSTTRSQLDHKARKQTEQERIDNFKHQTDLEAQEKARKENLASEKDHKTEEHEKIDKKHREEYLTTQQEKTSTHKQKASLFENQKLMQAFSQEKTVTEKTQTQQAMQETEISNELETKKTAADVSLLAIDVHTSTIGRSSDSVFGRFRDYLGTSGVINRTLGQYHKSAQHTAKNGQHFLGENAKENPPGQQKELVTEFAENNLHPHKIK